MRKNTRAMSLALVVLVTGMTVIATAANLKPVTDYDEALALSRETGKPVLLDFYFDT